MILSKPNVIAAEIGVDMGRFPDRRPSDLLVAREDARRFLDAMRERFEAFALTLHPDKTRLIEFGRHVADRRAQRGLGRPKTFNFLGFTYICGRSRRGRFQLQRRPDATACGRHCRKSRSSCATNASADPRAGVMATCTRAGRARFEHPAADSCRSRPPKRDDVPPVTE